MLVQPNAISLEMIAALIAASAELDGVKVHLYKNNLAPTVNSVVADFVAADFTGYGVSSAVVWGTPGISQSGVPLVLGDVKEFLSTFPFTVPNTVYGYYVTNTAGSKLLFAEKFETPQIISTGNQQIIVVPAWSMISQAG